ncbi:unnamed protein product [Bursaphelenchus okinawaensis]|uniref:Uncharacterized protein n=1 Tax=Bursaphelenchus okinawaensis TaxID=465554 RepID=A0A811LSW7_9BILA|nr:unnamed protein product [Bursaphelenchus okinawaensis]CAG9127770.1 unnamed protein product [Bursaphelenchus okinawaensis]
MGCRLSSHAKPLGEADEGEKESGSPAADVEVLVEDIPIQQENPGGIQQDNASGAQQNQVSSVEQNDYIDGVDISRVGRINIFIYGDSTELIVRGYVVGSQVHPIILRDEYEVIMEKLKLCFKKKRQFFLQVYLFDQCVWSSSLLSVMADLFISTLPVINNLSIFGDPRNVNVPFIDFYRKLHPIVERLSINQPTTLRFLIDMQIKSLTLMHAVGTGLNFSWLPLKFTQVNEVSFKNSSMLQVLCQKDIVMPQVCSVNFFFYEREDPNLKPIFENVFNVFPSLEQLTLEVWVSVQEKNEPIKNHELFTYTRTVFDTFERILDWNQEKLKIVILFFAYFNVPVNEDLARKMTEFAGYECCYKNGYFVLEVSMCNVDLRMIVK